MILVEGVTKHYGTGDARHTALDNVSVKIGRGEFVSIMGSSGSGKTTLLNIMGGLDRDWSGSVSVAGKPLQDMSDSELSRLRNASVGFVFQHFHLLDHVSCLGNVTLPSYFGTRRGIKVRKRASEVLQRVGLGSKLKSSPRTLSGGQKQRVAIARALFNHPEVMLCDEPTGSLDRKTGLQILRLFHEIKEDEGLTVVVVTHEEYVSRMASRIIKVEDGAVVADEPNEPQLSEFGGDQ